MCFHLGSVQGRLLISVTHSNLHIQVSNCIFLILLLLLYEKFILKQARLYFLILRQIAKSCAYNIIGIMSTVDKCKS